MKINDEFKLIDNISRKLTVKNKLVKTGIGDDCAVIAYNKTSSLLSTCDTLVENVHFRFDWTTYSQLGQKAMAVNISDIAAMGGIPVACLITLVLSDKQDEENIAQLYEGINNLCDQYQIEVAGGNISRGNNFIIDVFMMGTVNNKILLTRSGAKIGDSIMVTGTLGNAAAGLTVLRKKLPKKKYQQLIDIQLTPQPRLSAARIIAQSRLASSMIDVSDGLFADLLQIANSSQSGVEIWPEKIPVLNKTIQLAKDVHADVYNWTTGGGEDYELLFTAPSQYADKLADKIVSQTQTPVTIIGKVVDKKQGNYMLKKGKKILLPKSGWNHFQKNYE